MPPRIFGLEPLLSNILTDINYIQSGNFLIALLADDIVISSGEFTQI